MAGRSKNPNSDYVVILHQTGGYRYAATQPYKQDEKTGKLKRHYVYWGNVTVVMLFIPNQRFQLISPKTRKRFVFPKTWEKRLNRKSKGLHSHTILHI